MSEINGILNDVIKSERRTQRKLSILLVKSIRYQTKFVQLKRFVNYTLTHSTNCGIRDILSYLHEVVIAESNPFRNFASMLDSIEYIYLISLFRSRNQND